MPDMINKYCLLNMRRYYVFKYYNKSLTILRLWTILWSNLSGMKRLKRKMNKILRIPNNLILLTNWWNVRYRYYVLSFNLQFTKTTNTKLSVYYLFFLKRNKLLCWSNKFCNSWAWNSSISISISKSCIFWNSKPSFTQKCESYSLFLKKM